MSGLAALAALVASLLAVSSGNSANAAGSKSSSVTGSTSTSLQRIGTANLSQLATSSAAPSGKVAHPHQVAPLRVVPAHASPATPSTSSLPQAEGLRAIYTDRGSRGNFEGINAVDQRAANGFDVSPPDQGLAVGPAGGSSYQRRFGAVEMEFVNTTLAVYSSSGQTLAGPVSANDFFGVSPDLFLTDPRAYWDPQTGHWFLTIFSFASSGNTSPSCPNFISTDCSTQFIAVSDTTNPLGDYTIFAFDTTDTSNTAGECPCFGDFDMIGADGSGFYITTNEFSDYGASFNGTVMYAMSKSGLVSAAADGALTPTIQTYTVPYSNDPYAAYHLAPSTVTQGSSAPNTEYFVESNANLDPETTPTTSGLEVYALLNTDVLNSGGRPDLVMTTVGTEDYSAQPPNALQKSGPTPIGTGLGFDFGSPQLQTDFNAVQEVTYASGVLYAELSTGFTYGDLTNSGVAWFALRPTPGVDSVSVSNQANGYVETSQDILYPVIAVDAYGRGAMAFSIAGPDMYPSAAYVYFNGTRGPSGSVHVAAAGTTPLDDFTCYLGPPYGNYGDCRYGDYSMAQAYRGQIYMATEYAGAERSKYTNWSTRLYSVR